MRIIIVIFLFVQIAHSQTPYNHRLENGQVQGIGQLIHELDDSYLAIGRGIDTIDYLSGVYATEIDKSSGEIISTAKYTKTFSSLFFNRGNSVLDVNNKPYFLFHASDTIFLAYYSSIEKEIKVEKKIFSATETSSLFIYDFHYIDGVFYILSGHINGKIILKYNVEEDIISEVFLPDVSIDSPRMIILENDNYLITFRKFINGTAWQFVNEYDIFGSLMWQYKHDVAFENFSQSFLQVDSFTYIIAGGKARLVPNVPEGEGVPGLLKFDYQKKEIVDFTDFGIPDDEWFKWNSAAEEVVQSNNGEFFLSVAQLYDFPLNYDTLKSYGMVAKVDTAFNLIWRRRYAYIDLEYSTHELEDLIATTDGNYLCYGTSYKTFSAPGEIPILSWVFKIDEDGKIVGDTSTSNIEWDHEEYTEEISIFPNPASDVLYINQDDIKQVTYRVYDSNGKLDDEFDISSRNTSVMKDIGAWSSGIKFVQIIHEGKAIGSYQLVKN